MLEKKFISSVISSVMWTCYSSSGSIILLFCKKDNQLPYIYELFWMNGENSKGISMLFFFLSFECYCFLVLEPFFLLKFLFVLHSPDDEEESSTAHAAGSISST